MTNEPYTTTTTITVPKAKICFSPNLNHCAVSMFFPMFPNPSQEHRTRENRNDPAQTA